jgi:hypothetical protein
MAKTDLSPMGDSIYSLNHKKKTRLTVSVEDTTGQTISPLKIELHVIGLIKEYMKKRYSNDEDEVICAVGDNVIAAALAEKMGLAGAQGTLLHPETREVLLYIFLAGFTYAQNLACNNYILNGTEEPLSEEEFDKEERITLAAKVLLQAASEGVDPIEVAKQMIDKGLLMEEDLKDLGIIKE